MYHASIESVVVFQLFGIVLAMKNFALSKGI